MKKFLSVIIVLTLLMSSVSQGLFVFARNISEEDAIDVFARELSQMIRKNDFSVSSEEFFMNNMYSSGEATGVFKPDLSLYKDMPANAFETCRLVVKSDKKIDLQNAIDCVSGYNDLYVLQYDNELNTKKAYEYYLKCDSVKYVEPDIIYSSTDENVPGEDLPDDEASGFDEATAAALEWLADKIGFSDIKEKLANRIQDDYVLVAVIDSGVDTDHELLADRLIESDVNFSSTGEKNSVEDDYGHGTHVAGIVASHTLSNVKIKPYKVLNEDGNGSLSSIAVAIDMAVQDGADVINLSLSANLNSLAMTDAVNNAVENDVNVVVAAGNSSLDLDRNYVSPACIESAITVSAIDRKDKLAYFSNYDGPIDIAAPGMDIKSSYLNNTYLSLNGTSMAAPQVSAGIALIRSISLDEPAEQCEETIKEYAIAMHENIGENHFGAGVLFLKYLLDGKPTVADPVFSVDSCTFTETFELEITCPDEDATIYYLVYDTDLGSMNLFDSLEYSSPIKITTDTKVSAIAYADGKKPSSIVTVEYDRIGSSEEDFYEINELGFITGYYGSETDVLVPDVIRDKVVKGIAIGVFENNKKIKNVYLPGSCEIINPSAFKGCSSLMSVSGTGVTSVVLNAFENSTIETVNFPNLETIGSYAFSGCHNLSSVSFTNVKSIGSYAFQDAWNLRDISLPVLESADSYSFSQSGITLINAPELTTIGLNAFADCYNLVSVSAPALTSLSIGAFKNCIALKNIDMPLLTSIAANSLRNTGLESFTGMNITSVGNYALADNYYLEFVYLPLTVSTGTNIFLNCNLLKIVGLQSLEELNASTFAGCSSLTNLYLPSATSVVKNAFRDSSIVFLKFEKVQTIKSLPDKLEDILLPNTVTSITASTPKTDFIVYGYEDSFAEQYAFDEGKRFIPIPGVYHKSSTEVSADERYIMIYAVGFNCSYQWYKNDVESNVGGTSIEGAVRFYYEPSSEDNCAAYYCVITSDDGTNIRTATSNPIPNAPEYRDADYTEYNRLLEEIDGLDRDLYDKEYLDELDELLKTDISGLKLSQQDEINAFVSQLSVALELVKNSFVMGDVNGDNRVSAVDVHFVLKYVAELQEFTNLQFISADMNDDGEVTAVDARLIMQKALEL